MRALPTLALAAVFAAGGACASGDSRPLPERRAGCYPPCLAALVLRCPLVTACTGGEEPDPAVGQALSETAGVATCFDSGERMRYGTSLADGAEHWRVKADDGSPCYEATGRWPSYEIRAGGGGGDLVATFEDQRARGVVDVGCDGQVFRVAAPAGTVCGRLPWDPAATCNPGGACTFGLGVPADASADAP